LVPMEWLGNTFIVNDEKNALLAHVVVERTHPWERAATSRLSELQGAVTLGRTPIFGCREDGNLVRSLFLWDFDEAWVRPIDVSGAIPKAVSTVRAGTVSSSIAIASGRAKPSGRGCCDKMSAFWARMLSREGSRAA